jgi:hypothetical protein
MLYRVRKVYFSAFQEDEWPRWFRTGFVPRCFRPFVKAQVTRPVLLEVDASRAYSLTMVDGGVLRVLSEGLLCQNVAKGMKKRLGWDSVRKADLSGAKKPRCFWFADTEGEYLIVADLPIH